MPTYTAIAFKSLLEPRVRKSYGKQQLNEINEEEKVVEDTEPPPAPVVVYHRYITEPARFRKLLLARSEKVNEKTDLDLNLEEDLAEENLFEEDEEFLDPRCDALSIGSVNEVKRLDCRSMSTQGSSLMQMKRDSEVKLILFANSPSGLKAKEDGSKDRYGVKPTSSSQGLVLVATQMRFDLCQDSFVFIRDLSCRDNPDIMDSFYRTSNVIKIKIGIGILDLIRSQQKLFLQSPNSMMSVIVLYDGTSDFSLEGSSTNGSTYGPNVESELRA
ncbi:hypothetical protein HAX54_047614 [Datura stramonium]|uniref:Uncharacterized protein n=1 Tax=Datura stramonium TaxID=4076 RepID=A0ABS8WM62_DATST|nr:hypothetical protein [Datura stramonium]